MPARRLTIGCALFGAAFVGLGLSGFVSGDFAAILQPVAKDLPLRTPLVYLCAAIALLGGAGLLWPRTSRAAAAMLLGGLTLWTLVFRIPVLIRAPNTQDAWSNWGEMAVYTAAAWVLCAAGDSNSVFARTRPALGTRGARVLYGLALIPFGIAHFSYLKETAGLVPAYLPWRLAWAAATGGAYLAAALAILSGIGARLAALLCAVQMGGFTLLVWVPIVAAGGANAFQWNEFVISCVLTVSGWVLAESYRGEAWLALRRR